MCPNGAYLMSLKSGVDPKSSSPSPTPPRSHRVNRINRTHVSDEITRGSSYPSQRMVERGEKRKKKKRKKGTNRYSTTCFPLPLDNQGELKLNTVYKREKLYFIRMRKTPSFLHAPFPPFLINEFTRTLNSRSNLFRIPATKRHEGGGREEEGREGGRRKEVLRHGPSINRTGKSFTKVFTKRVDISDRRV